MTQIKKTYTVCLAGQFIEGHELTIQTNDDGVEYYRFISSADYDKLEEQKNRNRATNDRALVIANRIARELGF